MFSLAKPNHSRIRIIIVVSKFIRNWRSLSRNLCIRKTDCVGLGEFDNIQLEKQLGVLRALVHNCTLDKSTFQFQSFHYPCGRSFICQHKGPVREQNRSVRPESDKKADKTKVHKNVSRNENYCESNNLVRSSADRWCSVYYISQFSASR